MLICKAIKGTSMGVFFPLICCVFKILLTLIIALELRVESLQFSFLRSDFSWIVLTQQKQCLQENKTSIIRASKK